MTSKWRKSSYSSSQGDHCVELAGRGPVVGIRDSKAPESGHLVFERGVLAVLVKRLKES
ncbi:DUF397 domain-containing protein [Actinomadura hibisca]|uniref:DUF397 domain-containing protein n=1 Tax=Actinomadura hibisca TaxID=68565 RepID=UPI0009FF6958|nr:DUF397 domain-containing protein [Actinomadura hibisca]